MPNNSMGMIILMGSGVSFDLYIAYTPKGGNKNNNISISVGCPYQLCLLDVFFIFEIFVIDFW